MGALKHLFIGGVVLAALSAQAIAQDGDAPDLSARLAGHAFQWSLAVHAPQTAQCSEDWSFGADGITTIVSGQEHVTERYSVQAVPGEATMLALTQTRLTTNGEPDCQGVANPATGQTTTTYLVPLNSGGFFTCSSTDTMSCYGVASPRD